MKFAFRVDANQEAGLGHMMRCLALADSLRAEGAECFFVSRRNPINVLIRNAHHKLYELPEDELSESDDADATCSLLMSTVDWMIVDSYRFGMQWETIIRSHAFQVAAIDDLANRAHDVDLLIDQNELADRDHRYNGLVPQGSTCLLGSRYALLRREFSKTAVRGRDGSLHRILVSFGGTDPVNATGKALMAIERLNWADRKVDVVIGRFHSQVDAIATICGSHPDWTLHVQSSHIAELMQTADLAIGAGGTSTWERCALGLPSLILTIADNQRSLAMAVAEAGAAVWPGDAADIAVEDVVTVLATLDLCPQWLRSMSLAARSLCDGRGSSRVTRALLGRSLRLRPANSGDEGLTFEWRNHPEIRRYSGDKQAIDIDRHRKWFSEILTDKSRILLIAESLGCPIAVIRFDELSGSDPELSVYLSPQRLGIGWGTEVLQAATQWLRTNYSARTIRARVDPNNVASRNAFRKAGYCPQMQWWELPL